jgi:hypothetical protein
LRCEKAAFIYGEQAAEPEIWKKDISTGQSGSTRKGIAHIKQHLSTLYLPNKAIVIASGRSKVVVGSAFSLLRRWAYFQAKQKRIELEIAGQKNGRTLSFANGCNLPNPFTAASI